MALKKCQECGADISDQAKTCPKCGAPQHALGAGVSDKTILPAFLLCLFLGFLGAHRFFVGKTGTAVLQLFTFGGFGIWWLYDFIIIVTGSFSDSGGNKLKNWT